jgi:hypothetical protein
MKADHYNCAVNLLARLGNTPDEVAKKLFDLGIRGQRYSCLHNPLTFYLRHMGINVYSISVVGSSQHKHNLWQCGIWINTGDHGHLWREVNESSKLIPVALFMNKFENDGAYQMLEEVYYRA